MILSSVTSLKLI